MKRRAARTRAWSAHASAPLARWIAAELLARIHVGSLEIVESGRTLRFGSAPPSARLIVHSPRAWPALLRGSLGLAESYREGWVDSPDLVGLIRLAARNGRALDRPRRALAFLLVPLGHVRALLRPVTRRRSRRDVAAHYDLGNALFERMLDPTLSYSCALFEHPEMTLEEAQIAKLELVCEKLALVPTDHLLEIGAGWGALACYAARTRGCRVTTTTISREQHDYALAQVRSLGLRDRVTVLMSDYRDLRGRFDKLVSIEMIEAVGWRHVGRCFEACSELLAPGGLMLLQAITIDDRAYEVEKASHSFIKHYIFPGGSLPSLEVITRSLARRTDLQVLSLQDITPHYVRTLHSWRAAFLANARKLEELGYDERFRRIWTLYLAYCEAGFAERRITDIQLLLLKPGLRRERFGGPARLVPSTGLGGVERPVRELDRR